MLSAEDVIRLARQARFSLAAEEVDRFRAQLNSVLQQMQMLNELSDVANNNAANGPIGVSLREDDSSPDRLEAPLERLSNDLVARFFTVPRMLGDSGHTQ